MNHEEFGVMKNRSNIPCLLRATAVGLLVLSSSYLGIAKKSEGSLRWQVVETIKNPSSDDVDFIAPDQSLKRKAGTVTAEDIVRVRQECSEA